MKMNAISFDKMPHTAVFVRKKSLSGNTVLHFLRPTDITGF